MTGVHSAPDDTPGIVLALISCVEPAAPEDAPNVMPPAVVPADPPVLTAEAVTELAM